MGTVPSRPAAKWLCAALQSDIRKIDPLLATLTVPPRFNGPPAGGNGGYSCGLLSAHLEGPVVVSLRRPVPLDEPLEIRAEDGGSGRAFADGELVAEALAAAPPAPWDGPPVSLAEARAARERHASPSGGEFDRCFVCGRSRPDGFGVFTGPVSPIDRSSRSHSATHVRAKRELTAGRSQLAADGAEKCERGAGVVASPWTPPDWAADEDGEVAAEFVWAALDCPAYFALHGEGLEVAYLVRQQVEILAPPRAGVEYVVVGMPLERSGRKGLAATAILDVGGEVLAHAECLFVVPRDS